MSNLDIIQEASLPTSGDEFDGIAFSLKTFCDCHFFFPTVRTNGNYAVIFLGDDFAYEFSDFASAMDFVCSLA